MKFKRQLGLRKRKVLPNLKNKYQALISKLPSEVTLIAVSKKQSMEAIEALYNLGHRDFGENRVEELSEKSKALSHLSIRWHFIGNIQSKKIPQILNIKGLEYIHSVDRLKIINILAKNKCQQKIFLQANISNEDEKSGFETIEQLNEAYNLATEANLNVIGLMGMATIRSEDLIKSAHKNFDQLRNFRDNLDTKLKLSMGMSGDYEIALEKGSNYLRIGSYLFS